MRMLPVEGFLVISMPRGFVMMPRLVIAKALKRPAMMLSLACEGLAARNTSSTYVISLYVQCSTRPDSETVLMLQRGVNSKLR
jgi:hypothetical protein